MIILVIGSATFIHEIPVVHEGPRNVRRIKALDQIIIRCFFFFFLEFRCFEGNRSPVGHWKRTAEIIPTRDLISLVE
jgi:hypothetical protein